MRRSRLAALLVFAAIGSAAAAPATPTSGFPTQYGWAKPVIGPDGKTQHVVCTRAGAKRGTGSFATVKIRNGVPQFEAVAVLDTSYGQTELVQKDGRLQQQIKVGSKLYSVEAGPRGKIVFVAPGGKRHEGVVREGTSLITPSGRTTRVTTAEGPADVLVSKQADFLWGTRSTKEVFQRVELKDGQLDYTEIEPLSTPYGEAKIVLENGKLRQHVTVRGKRYTVAERADGQLEFAAPDGKKSKGVLRIDGAYETPLGRTRSLTFQGTAHDVLAERQQVYNGTRGRMVTTTAYQSVTHEGGEFTYTAIAPLETPFGSTTLVEKDGVLEHRITVGKQSFNVVERSSHTDYIDANGKTHRGLPRVGLSFVLPEGTTRTLRVNGRSVQVLTQKEGRWSASRGHETDYEVISVDKAGNVERESVTPLYTPYGEAELVERAGQLIQRVKIGKHELLAEERKDGSVVMRDAGGKVHSGAVRIAGALLTPDGLTQRVETAKGPLDVVPVADRWGDRHLSTVRFADGRFSYEPIEPIYTEYGVAHAVVRGGALVHELEIDGKRYNAVRRGRGVRFVDKDGAEYKDAFAETLRKPASITKTAIKSPFAKGKLPSLSEGPIVQILDARGRLTDHMAQETYTQLRDAMIETMKKFDPRTHYFIGLGSDPHPIIAFLDNLGGRELAVNFPASGKYNNGLDPEVLGPYVRRLIPAEVLNGSKTLVFLDQTTSNTEREGTLAQITPVFEQYLRDHGSKAKVKKLAYSPYAHPADTTVIDTNDYPEVGKFLGYPYEHVVSQYDRHVLGSNTPDQLIERPGYNQFRKAMSERMKRDTVLDKFLTGLGAK